MMVDFEHSIGLPHDHIPPSEPKLVRFSIPPLCHSNVCHPYKVSLRLAKELFVFLFTFGCTPRASLCELCVTGPGISRAITKEENNVPDRPVAVSQSGSACELRRPGRSSHQTDPAVSRYISPSIGIIFVQRIEADRLTNMFMCFVYVPLRSQPSGRGVHFHMKRF